MAKGSTHLAVEAFVGGALLTAAVVAKLGGHLPAVARWEHMVCFGVGFFFSMLLLSPDLDLRRSSHSRRWGIVRFIWWPYHLLFRHRGMSHSFLFGTLSRLLYLTVVALLAAAAFSRAWTLWGPPGLQGALPAAGWDLAFAHLHLMVAFIAGCYIPNIVHVAVDRVT